MRLLHSLQRRISIPLVLLILGSMGILGLYLVDFVRDTQINNLHTRLEIQAGFTAEATRPLLLSLEEQSTIDSFVKSLGSETDTRITVIAIDGTVLGDSEEEPLEMQNHADRPEVIDALDSGNGESSRYSITLGEQMTYLAIPITNQAEPVGIARVALPLTTVEDSVDQVVKTVVLATAITAVLVVLAVSIIARKTTQPIREITKAARAITSGELEQKIPVRVDDESGQLAQAFNEMSLGLKEKITTISEERGKLESILSSMADGVIMTDNEGIVVLANPAAEKFFGFKKDEVVGRHLIEVINDYEIDEVLKTCLKTASEQSTQLASATARRFLRTIAVPLMAERPTGALIASFPLKCSNTCVTGKDCSKRFQHGSSTRENCSCISSATNNTPIFLKRPAPGTGWGAIFSRPV